MSTLNGVERSNRKRTILSRLREYFGGASVATVGGMQKYYGKNYRATLRRLEGVPYHPLGKGREYQLEDIAEKMVQTEEWE